MSDDSEDGQANAVLVIKFTTHFRLDEIEPRVNGTTTGYHQRNDELFDEIAQIDEEQRRRRQLGTEARKDITEHRYDFDEQEDRDENRHDCDDGGIHHRGLNFLAEPSGVFQVNRKSRHDFGKQTALFTSTHHTNIKPTENFGMLLQSFRK